jgi:hypothetical protein
MGVRIAHVHPYRSSSKADLQVLQYDMAYLYPPKEMSRCIGTLQVNR